MNKTDHNLENLEKAALQLKKALNESVTEYIRDAAIQRFEFTYELLWKTLKGYLEDIHGIRTVSPRQVFKEAFALDILDDEAIFLSMIESRNRISHTYYEKQAEKIYESLSEYLVKINVIIEKLKQ